MTLERRVYALRGSARVLVNKSRSCKREKLRENSSRPNLRALARATKYISLGDDKSAARYLLTLSLRTAALCHQ